MLYCKLHSEIDIPWNGIREEGSPRKDGWGNYYLSNINMMLVRKGISIRQRFCSLGYENRQYSYINNWFYIQFNKINFLSSVKIIVFILICWAHWLTSWKYVFFIVNEILYTFLLHWFSTFFFFILMILNKSVCYSVYCIILSTILDCTYALHQRLLKQ